MTPSPDPIDFEHFPHQPLEFKVSRRRILSTLAEELSAGSRKGQGIPTPRLADLGMLADGELAGLIPRIPTEAHVTVRDGQVLARPGSAVRERRLFALESPAVLVVNAFNGRNTLEEAAGLLAQTQEWEASKAFAYARGVFLWLVWNGACRPSNF
jgi:hypothetical protein